MVSLSALVRPNVVALASIRGEALGFPTVAPAWGCQMRTVGALTPAARSHRTQRWADPRGRGGHCSERILCRLVEVDLVLWSRGDEWGEGRQPDVVEELANGARRRERGDDLHRPAAGITFCEVHGKAEPSLNRRARK